MASIFDFLHIKGRTAGSSNELSFDVLEQKSVEADGKASRGSKLPKAPKASQGSYHGVSGTSALSGQAEVEKRKKARRAHRVRLQVVGAVVIVALIAGGVYLAVRYHEGQVDFNARMHALVDRLAEVDGTLAEIDAMMIDPFDESQAAARNEALKKTTAMTTELNRVSIDAQTLLELSVDADAKVAIGQIGKAAQARNGMILVATEAFRFSEEAAEQVERANNVWNDVLNADQRAREGVSLANRASTQEATNDAIDALREARVGFETALEELSDMSATYGIDYSRQMAYLSKKIEALDKAIATSEALLDGDREAATVANEEYNNLDAEAVQLASELPPSIGDLAQEQFKSKMQGYKERYEETRNRTVEADSVIREYLER